MYKIEAHLQGGEDKQILNGNVVGPRSRRFSIAFVLAVYSFVFTGCSKPPTASPGDFVVAMSEAAQEYAGTSSAAGHDAPYKGKSVHWTLEYRGIRQGDKGPTLDFNLEPLGIKQKFFDSKYLVMLSFSPEPDSIDTWKQITPGSHIAFDGSVESVIFAQVSPGDMRSISYNVAFASFVGVRPSASGATR